MVQTSDARLPALNDGAPDADDAFMTEYTREM
ncbi:hypothetical protein M2212_002919 [Bradyrhizobium elkanii]|jgi:hypothetical protein|nr:hypothetical protein [Bradyrhizobium elkanii]